MEVLQRIGGPGSDASKLAAMDALIVEDFRNWTLTSWQQMMPSSSNL